MLEGGGDRILFSRLLEEETGSVDGGCCCSGGGGSGGAGCGERGACLEVEGYVMLLGWSWSRIVVVWVVAAASFSPPCCAAISAFPL